MKINRLNLGEIVLQKVEESGMSKAKFAELVGIARQNVEKTVFSKHSLDTDLLCRISEVLDCNFFDYYRSDTESNTKDYTTPINLRAILTIEMGTEKQEKIFRFSFGKNEIEILNK